MEYDFNSKIIYGAPYYANKIFGLNLYSKILNNWLDQPLTNETQDEIVNKIKNNDYSNTTLALALSEFLEPFSKTFRNLFEEGLSIEIILEWYKMSEMPDFDINTFLRELRLELPIKNKISIDMKSKIKETLKFALFFYHNSLITFKKTVKTLHNRFNTMTDDLRDRIIDKY